MKATLRNFLLGLLTALCLGFSHCSDTQPQAPLVMAIAASLSDVMGAITTEFHHQHPEISVQLTVAASGTLQRQIEQRAPIDLFASAALSPLEELAQQDLLVASDIRIFAKNQLVLVQRKNTYPQLQSFNEVTKPAVKRIAIGNPNTVPAGQYALNLLNLYPRLYDQLQASKIIILGENVRQVLTYIEHQIATAGFVYQSDLHNRPALRVIETFPESETTPILYAVAPLPSSQSRSQAQQFIQFIESPRGQAILQNYGFAVP